MCPCNARRFLICGHEEMVMSHWCTDCTSTSSSESAEEEPNPPVVVRTVTSLVLAAPAEASHAFGIVSFDDILNPLRIGARKQRGKGLVAIPKPWATSSTLAHRPGSSQGYSSNDQYRPSSSGSNFKVVIRSRPATPRNASGFNWTTFTGLTDSSRPHREDARGPKIKQEEDVEMTDTEPLRASL
jgi:hypothetical protein